MIITPNFLRLFIRLYPSAAMIAPRSCLNMIGRMPSWATASMRLLDGKHESLDAFRFQDTGNSLKRIHSDSSVSWL